MIDSIKTYLNQIPLSPFSIGVFFGILSFLLRIPFLFRYDLHYGGDPAIGYLMELRISGGDRPFYFYGQDYMGSLEPYLGAFLMKLFGASIPLAGAIGLFQWSAAVAIFVFLFTLSTSKFDGFIAGVVAAIGVPYTLTYMTEPFTGNASNIFITSLILLATSSILNKGGSLFRFSILGFTAGLGLFLNPQSMMASAASLTALCFLKTAAWNSWPSFRPSFLASLIVGALLGDIPGVWYKLSHVQTSDFFKIASPHFMFRNIECAGKCVLAYFDAHPISRISDGVYFWLRIPFIQILPNGFFDDLFLVLATAVLVFIGISLRQSFRTKNFVLFLFSSLVFINILSLILNAKTNADVINARRYLTASAVLFSIWTAYFFTIGLKHKSKIIQILSLLFIMMFLGRIIIHYVELVRMPDQLAEMRLSVQEMKNSGLNRGLADWPFSDILTSLSNQQVIVATWPGPEKIPDYADIVSSSSRIAMIKTNEDKIEPVIKFNGSKYHLDGNIFKNNTFWMAPYTLMK